MKKIVFIIFSVAFIHFAAFAQREVDDRTGWSLTERMYFGGGMGLNTGVDAFGNRFFYVGLNPIVGYMINSQLSVGTGVLWQHLSYTDLEITINQYGVTPFARYNFGQMFAYGEYMYISTPTFLNVNNRRNFDRLLLGLGYTQPLGKRGAINGMALYDVIYNPAERAFTSPWVFRVFFSF
ncbi:MAG TPA: hypothetical protein PKC24_14565 [Cyclobacteriaceae bacterium]|nr:hypothetical protein [Cyclobacteriaceae bacterium]